MATYNYSPRLFNASVVDELINTIAYLTPLSRLDMLSFKVRVHKAGLRLSVDDHALCNVISAIYNEGGYRDFIDNLAHRKVNALVESSGFRHILYTPQLRATLDYIAAEAAEQQLIIDAEIKQFSAALGNS